MATNATVKKYEFVVSAKNGSDWLSVAKYSTSKSSLPQSIAAFYKFFNSWKVECVEYRFDCSLGNQILWSDAFIPVLDE